MALTDLLGEAVDTGRLPSNNRNGGGSVGRITVWNNATDGGLFLFTSGQATYTGGSSANREYLKPGSVFVFLLPGQEAHKAYLAAEEDGVSYDPKAVLMVELGVRIGVGANTPKNLMPRLLAGEGRVFGALEVKKTPSGRQVKDKDGNLVPEMVRMFEGEVPFPNGEVFTIRVLPAEANELQKTSYSAWIPLDQEKLEALLAGNREEPTTDPLRRKKGTAVHKTPALPVDAEEEEEEDAPF